MKKYILFAFIVCLASNIKSQTLPYVIYNSDTLYVAKSDQSTGVKWNNNNTTTNASSSTNGRANTNIVMGITDTSTFAAKICANLVSDGFDDWFLPSKDELAEIYTNKNSIGGFANTSYWTSTEYSSSLAYATDFSNGNSVNGAGKQRIFNTRCVRKNNKNYTLQPNYRFDVAQGGISLGENNGNHKVDPDQRIFRNNNDVNVFDRLDVAYVMSNVPDPLRGERIYYRFLISQDTIPDTTDIILRSYQSTIDGASIIVDATNNGKIMCNQFPNFSNGYLLFEVKPIDFPEKYLKKNIVYEQKNFNNYSPNSDINIVYNSNSYLQSGTSINANFIVSNNSGANSNTYQPYDLYDGMAVNFFLSKKVNFDSIQAISFNKNNSFICFPKSTFNPNNQNNSPQNCADTLIPNQSNLLLNYPITIENTVPSGQYYLYVIPTHYLNNKNYSCISTYSIKQKVFINIPKIVLNNGNATLDIYATKNTRINENITLYNQGSATLVWNAALSDTSLIKLKQLNGSLAQNQNGSIPISINTSGLSVMDSAVTLTVNSNDSVSLTKTIKINLHVIDSSNNIGVSVDYNVLCSKNKLIFKKSIPSYFSTYASSCNYILQWSDSTGLFTTNPPQSQLNCNGTTSITLPTGYKLNKNYYVRLKSTSSPVIYGNPTLLHKKQVTDSIVKSACNSFQSPSKKYYWNSSGIYLDTLISNNGCDSVVKVNLTINSSNTSTISPNVCDSYKSPSGKIWTASNAYTDTIANAKGCDSIITINLTIKNSTTTTLNPTACNSYTSPSGKIWTTSNTYKDTIANNGGCDSVITINLTINTSYNKTATITLCSGSNHTFPDGSTQNNITTQVVQTSSLTAITTCDSIIVTTVNVTTIDTATTVSGATLLSNDASANYQWLNCGNGYSLINGQTNQLFKPKNSGNYAVELSYNNCKDTSACKIVTVNCFAYYTTTYDTLQNTFYVTVDSTTSNFAKSYYWNFGDGASSTSPAPSHTYTMDTVYNVCLKITTTTNDTCSYCHILGKDYLGHIYRLASFNLDVINPNPQVTGVATVLPNTTTIVVFPNPTSGKTELLFSTAINDATIRVSDIAGQVLLEKTNVSGNSYSLDLTHHAAGTYFIEVTNKINTWRSKLIKQ